MDGLPLGPARPAASAGERRPPLSLFGEARLAPGLHPAAGWASSGSPAVEGWQLPSWGPLLPQQIRAPRHRRAASKSPSP